MRHDVDPWSLLLGLAFAAIAVAALAGGLDGLWTDPDLWTARTVVPTALILVGLVLGAFATAMLRRRAPSTRAVGDGVPARGDDVVGEAGEDREARGGTG